MSLCQEAALDMPVQYSGRVARHRTRSLPVAAWELVGQVAATRKLSGLRYWLDAMTRGDPCQHAPLQAPTSAYHFLLQACSSAATELLSGGEAGQLVSATGILLLYWHIWMPQVDADRH